MFDRALSDNELTAWDRDHFFHPSTHMAQHARGETSNRIITSAEGVYVADRTGRRSLDAFAGLYCVNVGYGRAKITDAIAAQAAALPYYHAYVGHGSEPSIRLAKMIIDRAPAGMSRVFFGLSGSDANETNIKLVWYVNNVLGRAASPALPPFTICSTCPSRRSCTPRRLIISAARTGRRPRSSFPSFAPTSWRR
jgi:L-2,4-diaminobutyrate transaminase